MDDAERLALKKRLKEKYRDQLMRDVIGAEVALARARIRITRLDLVRRFRDEITPRIRALQEARPAMAETYEMWLQAYYEVMDELLRREN